MQDRRIEVTEVKVNIRNDVDSRIQGSVPE